MDIYSVFIYDCNDNLTIMNYLTKVTMNYTDIYYRKENKSYPFQQIWFDSIIRTIIFNALR